jgi:hypothetical protein
MTMIYSQLDGCLIRLRFQGSPLYQIHTNKATTHATLQGRIGPQGKLRSPTYQSKILYWIAFTPASSAIRGLARAQLGSSRKTQNVTMHYNSILYHITICLAKICQSKMTPTLDEATSCRMSALTAMLTVLVRAPEILSYS